MADRILYLPILDPSHHDRAIANKHGLRSALAARGEVKEFDYLASPDTHGELFDLLIEYRPDVLFTQLQGTDRVTDDDLRTVKELYPTITICNYNGDYWPEHLIAPDMLELLQHVDIQLVTNGSVLDTYAEHGINAAYWPHSFETPVRELPDVPAYDVLYLGNCYDDFRKELGEMLRALPYNVGIYGSGWPVHNGDCTYDFTMGEALYKQAKLTICDNEFTHARGYLSNRPFQAMAAGCFVLHQRVADLETMTGYRAGVHYGEFVTLDQIPAAVEFWLAHDTERRLIAGAGQAFTRREHSFEARVKQLFEQLLPEVSRV